MRLGFAVKVLSGGGFPSHDARRHQSEPDLSVSLDMLEAILDHLDAQDIRPLPARSGQAGVGRVCLDKRALAVEREPGMEPAVLSLGQVEVCLGRSRDDTSPDRNRLAISWARSRVRSVTRRRGSPGRR